MKRLISTCVLVTALLASCSDAGDSRGFWYYLNERYQLIQVADLGSEAPNAHAYLSLFEKHDYGDFKKQFDIERSVLEFRVRVEDSRPIGFGFVHLYKANVSEPVVNLDVNGYRFSVLSYQFGSYYCPDFSSTEPFYCGLREYIRFRLPVPIGVENETKLLTFEYTKIFEYEYPKEFKDLTWLL